MRHAFLIIAHNNWSLLARLLRKLDYCDNDIYLHIDLKAKLEDAEETLRDCCKYSKMIFVNRTSVTWGGYSQINCELRLFEEASKKKYDYYHVFSGIDFPTKPMNVIHEFFEENAGLEFIHMCDDEFVKKSAEKYRLYHFLQEYVGKERDGLLFQIERTLLFLQRRILKVNRDNKFDDMEYKCGSNWCSITDSCVRFLLQNEVKIRKMFKYTLCCDEFFVQTMVYNSCFREKLYSYQKSVEGTRQNLRCIDWTRGNPYTYKIDDYDELVESPNLFCRKVSCATKEYEELVNKLEEF